MNTIKIRSEQIYKIYHRERMNETGVLQTREFIKRMNLVITTPIFLRGYNEWCRNNGYSITVLTVNHYLSHFSQRLDIPVSELIEMRKDYEINYKTYFNHFNRYLTLSVYGEDTENKEDIKDLENLNVAIAIGVFNKHTNIKVEEILKTLESLYPAGRLDIITKEYKNKVAPMFYESEMKVKQ